MNTSGKSVYGRFLRILLPLSLLLTVAVFAIVEWYRFQDSSRNLEREIQAELATTSILLGKPISEQNIDQVRLILASVIANPHINGVTVYAREDRVVDSYGIVAGSPECNVQRTSINYSDGAELSQLGTLVLCYTNAQLLDQTLDLAARTSVLIGILLLSIILISYLSYRNSVGVPLTQLSAAINARLSGASAPPVTWPSQDEIGQVISEFNAMQEQIRNQEQATRDYQADLEQAIASRTGELNLIQSTLKQSNETLMSLSSLTGSETHAELFQHLLEVLVNISASEVAFIAEVEYPEDRDPILNVLNFHAGSNTQQWRDFYLRNAPPAGEKLAIGNTNNLLGEVVKTSCTVFSDNIATDNRRGKGLPANHPNLRNFVGIPVKDTGNKVIGLIGLSNRIGGYDDYVIEQIEPLLAAVHSILVTHRNLDLRRQAENRVRTTNRLLEAQQTALTKLEHEIVYAKNEKQALQLLVDNSGDLLEASVLSIWRFTENRNRLERLAAFDDSNCSQPLVDSISVADPDSLNSRLLNNRPILVLRGPETKLLSGPEGTEFACSYILPIVIDQSTQGLVCIDYLEGELSANERIFASALGGLVSIVFQRMRTAELQVELQQSQKMDAVGRLAGGIAHDFNNLLTAITGFAELAMIKMANGASNKEVSRDLDEVLNTTQRASALTNQLLTFSRKEIVKLEVLELNELLRSTLQMLRRVIREDIVINSQLTREPLYVRADPGQLEQVFLNLSVNAGDAMPDGGSLDIVTAVENDSVIIRFSDTGAGIDADVQDKIFEPFFTTKQRTNSVGLGLATVHRIINDSQGDIELTSQLNEGATFVITLPRQNQPAEAETESAIRNAPITGTFKILVAEDELQVCELMKEIFESAGHEVLAASSGEHALELIENDKGRPIDLLVTDMIMPGIKGTELATKLRGTLPELPVLFVSGYTDNAFGAAGSDMPENSWFLQKPFTSKQLLDSANMLLEGTSSGSLAEPH